MWRRARPIVVTPPTSWRPETDLPFGIGAPRRKVVVRARRSVSVRARACKHMEVVAAEQGDINRRYPRSTVSVLVVVIPGASSVRLAATDEEAIAQSVRLNLRAGHQRRSGRDSSRRGMRILGRMPRVQVYLPDDLHDELKRRGLPASELLQIALRAELERQDALAATTDYVDELADEVGQPNGRQQAHADAIARRIRARALSQVG